MGSPLPDSSALEAGIIEDERPSRLSRVHDNVRQLLRTSVMGSAAGSPTIPSDQHEADVNHLASLPSPVRSVIMPEVIPSPSTEGSTTAPSTNPTTPIPDMPSSAPRRSYRRTILEMARQSVRFNSGAVAALNHPDLSNASAESLTHQKAERRHRQKKRSHCRRRRNATTRQAIPALVCFFAAVLLATLVATYIALVTTSSGNITPTFHILFILGILLATIMLAYTIIRLCMLAKHRPNQPAIAGWMLPSRNCYVRPRYHHRGRHNTTNRSRPTLADANDSFVPPAPIPVHVASDEISMEPISAEQPVEATQIPPHEWNKVVQTVQNPPPAYGRWRGSVRANPDLLHWQPIPSPKSPELPPSPTYEEVMASTQNGSPPSYVTRDSPARRREMDDVEERVAQVAHVVEPEMVEVRTVGVGTAL